MYTEGLSYRERVNLAALRIKSAQVKRQYGGAVQIVDEPMDIVGKKGILAIPLQLLPEKTYAYIMNSVKRDANGNLILPEDWEKIDPQFVDIVEELEELADKMEGKIPAKVKKSKIPPKVEVEDTKVEPVVEAKENALGKVQRKPVSKNLSDMSDEEFLMSL